MMNGPNRFGGLEHLCHEHKQTCTHTAGGPNEGAWVGVENKAQGGSMCQALPWAKSNASKQADEPGRTTTCSKQQQTAAAAASKQASKPTARVRECV